MRLRFTDLVDFVRSIDSESNNVCTCAISNDNVRSANDETIDVGAHNANNDRTNNEYAEFKMQFFDSVIEYIARLYVTSETCYIYFARLRTKLRNVLSCVRDCDSGFRNASTRTWISDSVFREFTRASYLELYEYTRLNRLYTRARSMHRAFCCGASSPRAMST